MKDKVTLTITREEYLALKVMVHVAWNNKIFLLDEE